LDSSLEIHESLFHPLHELCLSAGSSRSVSGGLLNPSEGRPSALRRRPREMYPWKCVGVAGYQVHGEDEEISLIDDLLNFLEYSIEI
jgi:hypothetical protein